MKVKITHPVDGLEAGRVYDVPDEKAAEYIAADIATPATIDEEIDERLIQVSKPENKKKVKHGNG